MAKYVKTAKGATIDFELFRIKQSLSSSPTSIEVKARENFIEKKMKRRMKKAKNKMLENIKDEKEEVVEEPTLTVSKKRKIKRGE